MAPRRQPLVPAAGIGTLSMQAAVEPIAAADEPSSQGSAAAPATVPPAAPAVHRDPHRPEPLTPAPEAGKRAAGVPQPSVEPDRPAVASGPPAAPPTQAAPAAATPGPASASGGDPPARGSNTHPDPALTARAPARLAAPAGHTGPDASALPEFRTAEGRIFVEAPARANGDDGLPAPATPPPPEARIAALAGEILAAQRPGPVTDTATPADPATGGPEPAAPAPPDSRPAASRSAVETLLRGATPDQVEIAIESQELGPVRFAIRLEEGGVHLACAADRAETLDLLRRHAAILAAELREGGMGSASFSFAGDRADGRPRPHGGHPFDSDQPAAPPARAAADTGRALDLRL